MTSKNSPEGCVGLSSLKVGERSASGETAHAKALEVGWDDYDNNIYFDESLPITMAHIYLG